MKKNNLLFALLCCAPFAASAQFPVLSSTSISDFRLGPNSGGPNTGVFKWTTANELGIFTWADGKPIRIGGTLVKFQHESGNPNNVYMSGNLGVGVTPGTARLTVNSGTAGESGLLFTQLTSGSTTSTINDKCLSVDAAGKVIMTNTQWKTNGSDIFNGNSGGVAIGTTSLLPNSKLSVTGSATSRLGIVSELTSVLPSPGLPAVGVQANVIGNYQNEGFHAKTSGGDFSTGGIFEAAGSTTVTTGVQGWADGGSGSVGGFFWGKNAGSTTGVGGAATGDSLSGSNAKAGTFTARDAGSVVGVNAEALSGPGNIFNYGVNAVGFQSEGNYNYGVKSSAQTHANAIRNAGVYTIASVTGTSNTCTNYGVYSLIDGNSAIAPNPANGSGSYAGYFWDNSASTNASGSAFFNGVIVASTPGVTAVSDRKFKKDIDALENAVDKVMKLSPVSYSFKGKEEFPSFTFPSGKQLGFIAQELETVFPEIVHQSVNPAQYDDKGNKIADKVEFKGVDYTSLIPVLTKAIQEQQTQIENQQAQIEELKKMLASSNANGSMGNTNTTTDAATKGYLSQNVPNPFTKSTVISYQLPANTKTAGIGVYDLNGREIKLFTLGAETTGSVTIDGVSMQPGMYVYTLLVNGMPYETKKMVLTSH